MVLLAETSSPDLIPDASANCSVEIETEEHALARLHTQAREAAGAMLGGGTLTLGLDADKRAISDIMSFDAFMRDASPETVREWHAVLTQNRDRAAGRM